MAWKTDAENHISQRQCRDLIFRLAKLDSTVRALGKEFRTKGMTSGYGVNSGALDAFTGCGKTKFLKERGKAKVFEGDGLQAVHKRLKTGPASAAEGTAFALYSTFFRKLLSRCGTISLPNLSLEWLFILLNEAS